MVLGRPRSAYVILDHDETREKAAARSGFGSTGHGGQAGFELRDFSHPTPSYSNQPLEDVTTNMSTASKWQRQRPRHFSKQITIAMAVVSIVTLASLVIMVWLIAHISLYRGGSFTSADIIGGHFEVTLAKMVDVIASIVIGPSIVALANYYIFQLVRACAVNDKPPRKGPAVSLEAMIEVSATDWGSYSPFKQFNLLRAKEPRLMLVGAVAFLSALSFSFLSNTVAYQVVSFAIDSSTVSLNGLYTLGRNWDAPRDDLSFGGRIEQLGVYSFPNMTTQQSSDFTSSLFNALNPLTDIPSKMLTDHAFIRVNVSSSSLNKIAGTIRTLYDVPTVKFTYKCEPSIISNISMDDLGGTANAIYLNASTRANSQVRSYIGASIGFSSVLQGQHYRQFRASVAQPFVAFSPKDVWLGVMQPKTSPSNSKEVISMNSPFGEVVRYTHNNTRYLLESSATVDQQAATDEANDMLLINFYGIICTTLRQTGASVLHRKSQNSAGIKDWDTESPPTFSDDQSPVPDTAVPVLFDLQLFPALFSGASIPALGGEVRPGLAASLTRSSSTWKGGNGMDGMNFENIADAYLYAEGQAKMLAYDIVQTADAQPVKDLVYNVRAQGEGDQLYSMTYVPWILLSGLLSLALAGALTLGLAVYSLKTHTFRTGRIMTTLRLALDLGTALPKETFQESLYKGNDEMNHWARQCMLNYELDTPPNTDYSNGPDAAVKRVIRLRRTHRRRSF